MNRSIQIPLFILIVLSLSCNSLPKFDLLSTKWAKYIAANPGAHKMGSTQAQASIHKANKLSQAGLQLYRAKKDKLAVIKYEQALKLYATGELYFRYANSLANIPRIVDSAIAYQIARQFGLKKDGVVAYNSACAYSQLADYKKAAKLLLIALEDGYNAFKHIQQDPDISHLRSSSYWPKIAQKIKKLRK